MKRKDIGGLRRLSLKLAHGTIRTPAFLPDATRGFVRLIGGSDLEKAGLGPLVVNTLHLYLQPGTKLVKRLGGLNKLMGYGRPLVSDSGGYQVFSLIHKQGLGRITEEGAEFRSPYDGSKQSLTPESSIAIQFDLGVDVMTALDDCPLSDGDGESIRAAVERTIRWAERSKAEYARQLRRRGISPEKRPLLMAVVQGGFDPALRKRCAEALVGIGFDGYGFGSRHYDASGRFRADILGSTATLLPPDAFRFALGMGTPEDIKRASLLGWDLFDCVIPTREGRHGRFFRRLASLEKKKFYDTLNLDNEKFACDKRPLNPESAFADLRNCSFAYARHLLKSRELLGARLASLNNLEFYAKLMAEIRKSGSLKKEKSRGKKN